MLFRPTWARICRRFWSSQLKDWGVTAETAAAAARENLAAGSTQDFLHNGSGVFASGWQDTYDASRLLLPGMFSSMKLPGRPVVVVPHRDRVLVGGSEDEESLFAALQTELEKPYSLSPRPLLWTEEGWLAHQPRLPAWRDLAHRYEVGLYNSQAAHLNESLSEDIFVASLLSIARGEHCTEVVNWAAWVLIQVSPEPRSEPRCYAWEDFLRGFAAYLRVEPGVNPRCYRTWVSSDRLLP